MEIHLTADQEAFIREAIASGRYQRAEEAVQEALSLWEERERLRIEILVSIDKAEASVAAGRGIAITAESMQALAERAKKQGYERLTKDQISKR